MSPKLDRAEVSLLELRNDTFFADRVRTTRPRKWNACGQEPCPGRLRPVAEAIQSADHTASRGRRASDTFVLGRVRHLEVRGQTPVQIAAVDTDKDSVRVRLNNASKFARVHVFATRYEPEYDPFSRLGSIVDAEPVRIYPCQRIRCMSRVATSATSTVTCSIASRRKNFPGSCWNGRACCSTRGPFARRKRVSKRLRKAVNSARDSATCSHGTGGRRS